MQLLDYVMMLCINYAECKQSFKQMISSEIDSVYELDYILFCSEEFH